MPLLYEQFEMTPSTSASVLQAKRDLLPTIRSRTKVASELRDFRPPVRIIFGIE